ncbi:MAG: ABC transporter permease [Flavobacteriales bacterium]|jgi:putative ABC transport system permease protein
MFLRLLKESFVFAWQALVVNKLRTTLSLLGVTIGIFSIIFVLSVVDSMEADMKSSLDMIGSDILFVQKWPMGPEEGDKEFEWWKYMSRRQPSLKDMEKLDKRLDVHSAIAFQTSTEKAAEYKNNFLDPVFVTAVSYEYLETITLKIQTGRYFTKQECDAGKNVAIIGSLVAEQLFGSEEALGKDIKVGGLKCSVIGVLKKEGASLFGNGTDQAVFLPVEFGLRLMDLDSQDGSIIVKAKEGVSNQELKDQVIATFREIRSIKPGRDRDFSIIESKMISGMVDSIVGVFNIAGMIIGIFAILVGAFSIANIMFVSVRERTNIIGIQKSLGAKNYFILFQFLFESIALCLIGGAFGLLLVFLLAQILTAAFEFEFILPLSRIVMGISISVIVGVISGFVPAWRASRLNPVDAIRSK